MDIRFSDGAASLLGDRMNFVMSGGPVYFTIFKGTVPTSVNPDYAYVSSTRDSDRLVRLVWNSHDSQGQRLSVNGPVVSIESNKLPTGALATQSGTATWFAMNRISATYGPICGTITTPGSGGDLVIPDTGVVSGLLYTLSPISFTIQQTMTY